MERPGAYIDFRSSDPGSSPCQGHCILREPGAFSGGEEKAKVRGKNWQREVGAKARSPFGKNLTTPVPNNSLNAAF